MNEKIKKEAKEKELNEWKTKKGEIERLIDKIKKDGIYTIYEATLLQIEGLLKKYILTLGKIEIKLRDNYK